jgi:hypothetical protein
MSTGPAINLNHFWRTGKSLSDIGQGNCFNRLTCEITLISGGRWLEESVLFLEFEYIFGMAVALVILLIVLFYVVYPYDKDLK